MKKKSEPSEHQKNLEHLNARLVENFVSMQKVMTNLSIKFDKLADNMSKLLGLFELAARSFGERVDKGDMEKDQEFLNKLNMLVEQNKTLAKGLTLMEEKMRERLYGGPRPEQRMPERTEFSPSVMPQVKKLPQM
jgi:hypothetical protein